MKTLFINSNIFQDNYLSRLALQRLFYYVIETNPNCIVCTGVDADLKEKYDNLIKKLSYLNIKFINNYCGIIDNVLYDQYHVITNSNVIEKKLGTIIELDLNTLKYNYVFLDLLGDIKFKKYHHLKHPCGLHGKTSVLIKVQFKESQILN